MKRFHVHVGVTNLEKSITFYSGLFGAKPSVRGEGPGTLPPAPKPGAPRTPKRRGGRPRGSPGPPS